MKGKVCPQCGSTRVADILYGYPVMNEELDMAIKKGEVTLGGCCISPSDPKVECMDCMHRW